MEHNTQDRGEFEVCVCRYTARFGEPITPEAPRFATDTSASAWHPHQTTWQAGSLVVVWTRQTRAPLIVMNPIDPPPPVPPAPLDAAPAPFVENAGPSPVADPLAHLSSEERDRAVLEARFMTRNVHAGPPVSDVPQVPSLAPPPIQALPHHYHLPHYARQRAPLALQRNVSERGGVVGQAPATAPGYAPPPTYPGLPLPTYPVAPVPASPATDRVTVGGDGGLLAGAEVRAYSGPMPPSPLDVSLAKLPSSPLEQSAIGVTPPAAPVAPLQHRGAPPPQGPLVANTAVSVVGPMDLAGNAHVAPVAPPRLAAPPIYPSVAPADRSIQPAPGAAPELGATGS